MEKPPGWQEEQAVEIRRDWIAYLADGMGIDAPGATGAELETLVVQRMLEQAVRTYDTHPPACKPSFPFCFPVAASAVGRWRLLKCRLTRREPDVEGRLHVESDIGGRQDARKGYGG